MPACHTFGQLHHFVAAGECVYIPIWDSLSYSPGGDPRLPATAEPEEQDGEQAGEHWPQKDTHGPDAGSPGTGAGGGLLGHEEERSWMNVPDMEDGR